MSLAGAVGRLLLRFLSLRSDRGWAGGFPLSGPQSSQLSAGVQQLPRIPSTTLPQGPFPDMQGRGKSLHPLALFEEQGWDPEKRWFI